VLRKVAVNSLSSAVPDHAKLPIVRRQGRPDDRVRVFLECTTTWGYGGNTGIQRAVRNIVNRTESVSRCLEVVCQPLIWGALGWQPIESLGLELAPETDQASLDIRLHRKARSLAALLPSPFGRIFFDYRVKRLLRSAVSLVSTCPLVSRYRASGNGVQFQPGDVLFLLDSTWHINIWPGVSVAKEQGARVGIMLYDLVPAVMPEMCVPEMVASFDGWVRQAVSHADFFVCISEAVAEQSRRHLEDRFSELRKRKMPFGSIRLGAELDTVNSAAVIRPALKEVFDYTGRPRPYLCVGTIEPRKNHRYLLDAFDLAWTQGAQARLCIVGRKGWKCAQVLERLQKHPQLGRRLFVFNDLSDAELQYCYRNAATVILPSIAEGFGLPVVEALTLGCRAWLSDIPVFREVGGEYCLYFDLRSPQSLAELIMRDERGLLEGPVRPLSEFHWPDWQESCRELLQKILELVK
jgi:glycosyltransferase involved in cell wall biosynthesis